MLRNDHERLFLMEYLVANISYFSNIATPFLKILVRKMTAEEFKQDSIIFKIGDPGDKLYVLYSGKVQIILDGQTKETANIFISHNSVFGEIALKMDVKRNATVRAHTDVQVMVIYKSEYDYSIAEYKMKEMKSSFLFMKMLPMFKEIPNYIIDLLNKQMEVRTLKPGDVLFKQGQPAKVFYIVKKGILHMNCLIDVEMYNKIPVDVD